MNINTDHLNRCISTLRAACDLPPMFVPPVMLVRQARGQGRPAREPQAPVRTRGQDRDQNWLHSRLPSKAYGCVAGLCVGD